MPVKLADLRPCDACGGPVMPDDGRGFFTFVTVQISEAVSTKQGLDHVVLNLGEADPKQVTHVDLVVCKACSLGAGKPIEVANLIRASRWIR